MHLPTNMLTPNKSTHIRHQIKLKENKSEQN
jgi:hypothetical protein